MQINFTTEEKVLMTIILDDALSGAKKANDRASRRYGQKLQNKIDPRQSICFLKLNELTLLGNLINQFLDKVENIDKKQKGVIKENIEVAKKLNLKILDEHKKAVNRIYK